MHPSLSLKDTSSIEREQFLTFDLNTVKSSPKLMNMGAKVIPVNLDIPNLVNDYICQDIPSKLTRARDITKILVSEGLNEKLLSSDEYNPNIPPPQNHPTFRSGIQIPGILSYGGEVLSRVTSIGKY
jgi:hypothetical protein